MYKWLADHAKWYSRLLRQCVFLKIQIFLIMKVVDILINKMVLLGATPLILIKG